MEVCLACPDASGHGEGKTLVGSTVTPGLPGCYTALEIVGLFFFASSEFGPNTCLQLFVPVLLR